MRKRVVVLFGGLSEEAGVSVKSAAEIARHIDTEQYEPVYVGITKAGEWRLCGKPCADWEAGETYPAFISPDRSQPGLVVRRADRSPMQPERTATRPGAFQVLPLDAVFPVLHGRMGEDGTVQGLLELSGIPYVGCGVAAGALCMDKALTYLAAREAGVAVPEFRTVDGENFLSGESLGGDCAHSLPYPVFVKPARSGSSFGVTKVTRAEDLPAAVAAACAFDRKVLIERAVTGAEVGCAVLGNGPDGLFLGEPDMITLSGGFFRIHQEAAPELGSENAAVTVPAPIPAAAREAVCHAARKVYAALGCRGLARVDFFLRPDGCVVLNEVNTMPGFTSYSRYPRMMAAAGLGMTALIGRLITLAIDGECRLRACKADTRG